MMRLPVLDGDDGAVDEAAAAEMVDFAYQNGINYFDTAWGYHNGNSELTAGKCLSKYPRESFYLADKFPGYDLSNMDKVEEIFEKQLKKCQTSYFDFYLFHNVYEGNIDAYLDPKYGILDYLLQQKENGRIRHLGFSAHGSLDVIRRFLDAYGEHLEFCQLQVNYMDWHFQDAQAKVALIREAGIDIIATNRGYIVNAPHAAQRVFKVSHTDEQMEDELCAVVDLGGKMVNVMINHRVYGRMEARLGINSRKKVMEFMEFAKKAKMIAASDEYIRTSHILEPKQVNGLYKITIVSNIPRHA